MCSYFWCVRKVDISWMEGFSREIHVTCYIKFSHLRVVQETLQEFIVRTVTILKMKRVINVAIPGRNIQKSSRSNAITFLYSAIIYKWLLKTSTEKDRMIDLAINRIWKAIHIQRNEKVASAFWTDLCYVGIVSGPFLWRIDVSGMMMRDYAT